MRLVVGVGIRRLLSRRVLSSVLLRGFGTHTAAFSLGMSLRSNIVEALIHKVHD